MQDVFENSKIGSTQIGHNQRSFQLRKTSSNKNKHTGKIKQLKTDHSMVDLHSGTMPTINRSDDNVIRLIMLVSVTVYIIFYLHS